MSHPGCLKPQRTDFLIRFDFTVFLRWVQPKASHGLAEGSPQVGVGHCIIVRCISVFQKDVEK